LKENLRNKDPVYPLQAGQENAIKIKFSVETFIILPFVIYSNE